MHQSESLSFSPSSVRPDCRFGSKADIRTARMEFSDKDKALIERFFLDDGTDVVYGRKMEIKLQRDFFH